MDAAMQAVDKRIKLWTNFPDPSEVTDAMQSMRREVDALKTAITSVARSLEGINAQVSRAEKPSEVMPSYLAQLRRDLDGTLGMGLSRLQAAINALALKPEKEVDLSGMQSAIQSIVDRPEFGRTEVVEVPALPSGMTMKVIGRDKNDNISQVKVEVIE